MTYEKRWETVDVKVQNGIAWVTFNRPEKKNAMSPTLNREMIDVLETIELDQEARVVVLTGAGDSWTAGMDLKEYFREVDSQPEIVQERIRRDSCRWQFVAGSGNYCVCIQNQPSLWLMDGVSVAVSPR